MRSATVSGSRLWASSPLMSSEAPQLAGERLGAGEQADRLDRGRGLVGEDHEDVHVLGVELVEAELREGDRAGHPLVVAHRDDEHRLVHLVRAGDRRAARVGVGVRDEERRAVLGGPAGEPDPELGLEQGHVDLLVRPDRARERDRDEQVGRLEHVDPGVVVIDDPARLLDDRPADRLDRVLAAHPGRRRLEDAHLAGPRRRPARTARRC